MFEASNSIIILYCIKKVICIALTNKGMKLVYDVHQRQFDTGEIPYVFHLAEEVDNEICTCIVLLHNAVEDNDITMEQLEKEFLKEVSEVLKLLTKHR